MFSLRNGTRLLVAMGLVLLPLVAFPQDGEEDGEREPTAVAAGDLEFKSLEAQEGSESFSLKLLVAETGDTSGDDEYYEARANGSRFDAIELYPFVRVTPAVSFSISAKRNGFLLVGAFKPRTAYKVTLKAGLASRAGKRVTKDQTQEVKTGDFSSRFAFKSKARYLPGSMQGSLAWEAINVDQVQFEVRQIYTQNLHQWLTHGESVGDSVSDIVKTVTVPVKGKKNRLSTGAFSLNGMETLGQGVFEIVASPVKKAKAARPAPTGEEGEGAEAEESEESYGRSFGDRTMVIVTNLSVVAKRGAQEVKVWVMGTKDLAPMKDAQVELVSLSNQKLDVCHVSGANAECTLTWKKREAAPYAMIVRSGKDLTYLRFEDLSLSNDAFQAGKRDYGAESGGLDAYVYAERDLYRPGETVNLSAMVRNKGFEAVAGLPLRWTVMNPKGKVVREVVSDTSEQGLAQFEYRSTPAGETGKYTVSVTAGGKVLHEIGVMVEEFVPERIGLKVTPVQEIVVGKASGAFAISALYLFGPPVADGAYSVACSMRPAFKVIPNRADYATGFYSKEERQPLTLEAKQGKLDAKGGAQASCEWGTAGVPQKLAEVFELRAKVDVSEAGSGRATSKSSTAFVASTDTLVGLKLAAGRGRSVNVRGGFFDFKGQAKPRKTKLKAQLFNMREHWYYTSGNYDSWKVEEMITPTGVEKTIDADGTGFEFSMETPEGWGRWLVRVIDTQTGYTADLDAGHIGWYYDENGRGKGGRAPEPSALKIELSKKEVSPGEKIEAMVEAPFAGRLLLAFETEKTLETRWIRVDKPGQVKTELKVPETLPNVYLTALLVKDPVEGKRFLPARAWGATSIQIVPEAHRLAVKISAPELSESRREVTVSLSNDRKTQVEYSLAVVDEGILQITGFKSPDPLKRFFEARALGVVSSETLGWTVAGASGKNPGGDEGKNAGSKNMPVSLVSYWFPAVKSDASGRAEVKLKLPAFQGKVRLMAVASAKARMGSGSEFMTVRDPLVLQPTLPRFLTQGDKFQFPVAITNLSGKEQTVSIEVAPGPLVVLSAGKQSLTIPDGQMRTARFDAEVKGVIGNAGIVVTAASADGKLKSNDSFDIPVKPAGIEQTIRLSLDARQEALLALHVPPGWRGDYMRVEAAASSLPYLNQISHLDSLLHYPYGCIEQTTSGTMPLLAMGDLLKWVDSKKAGKVDIKDMVARGIARVLSMQTASGGFAYWPGSGEPNPWGTAYATNMLLEAKTLGYAVPASALKNALDYLETLSRNSGYKLARHRSYDSSSVDPFALYVLAKGGRAVMPQLRQTVRGIALTAAKPQAQTPWTGIGGEDFFLLATTAKLLGDNETLKALSDESVFSMKLVGKRDDEHTYWSSMRSDGMRLSIIEDQWPQHPGSEILVQRVAASLGGKDLYYSTQDLAWSVLALGKRIRGLKKADQSELQKIGLLVNGKRIAKSGDVQGGPVFTFDGPGLAASRMALTDLPAANGVFMYVKATGYTNQPPVSKSGFTIERRFLKRDGTTANLMAVLQGETLFVEVKVTNAGERVKNLAIVDRLPAGFEIENPRLGRSEDLQWMTEPLKAEYQDLRDDRIQVFGDLESGASGTVYYSVRAVTKGRYTAPAALVEAMYDPENFDYGQDIPVQIVDAAPGK